MFQTSKKGIMSYDDLVSLILQTRLEDLHIPLETVQTVIKQSTQIFGSQPLMLLLQSPIKIVGSIHGQLPDLITIFNRCGYPGDINYLFLGDYIDYGKQSIQTLVLLLAFKNKYPSRFFMLRGHHELASVNKLFGFYQQCIKKYGSQQLWSDSNKMFDYMPVCANIMDKIFAVHGGISPQLDSLKIMKNIERPINVSKNGLVMDLLWSDPQIYQQGFKTKAQGISFTFGFNSILQFLSLNKLEMIVRSRQCSHYGYSFFQDESSLVSIFSAPNFKGEYNNYGAIMVVTNRLEFSFELIEPMKE